MRLAALLITSLLSSVVGCAASSSETGSASADVTSGVCTAAYEDDAIVVYADHTYAPKQLHVTELRITPANPNDAIDWKDSRFYESHLEYVLAPRVSDDALAKARAAVNADLTPATIAIDASTGSTQTMLEPGASAYSVAGDSLVAELTDHFTGPLEQGSGPLIGASLDKKLLLRAGAKAKANGCDLALSSGVPVAFDVNEAKVLVPDFEMATIEGYLGFSNAIRSGMYKSSLALAASPAVDAAAQTFSDYIEREVRPLTVGLATLSHDELLAKLDAAWVALRTYATVVLTETHSSADVDHFITKRDDGTWSTTGVSSSASPLLFFAASVKTDLEGVRRDTNGGWTTRPLE